MSYFDLFNEALALCIKANSHAIAHSLQVLTKAELVCVIGFLSQLIS